MSDRCGPAAFDNLEIVDGQVGDVTPVFADNDGIQGCEVGVGPECRWTRLLSLRGRWTLGPCRSNRSDHAATQADHGQVAHIRSFVIGQAPARQAGNASAAEASPLYRGLESLEPHRAVDAACRRTAAGAGAGKTREQFETDAPKHDGEPAITRTRGQGQSTRTTTLTKSAKPPSPVQIRAAPPFLKLVDAVTCGRHIREPSCQLQSRTVHLAEQPVFDVLDGLPMRGIEDVRVDVQRRRNARVAGVARARCSPARSGR